MIVRSLMKFGDKTTGATYEEQVKIEEGQVFECDKVLAEKKIKKGLVRKATPNEIKKYKETLKKDN